MTETQLMVGSLALVVRQTEGFCWDHHMVYFMLSYSCGTNCQSELNSQQGHSQGWQPRCGALSCF